MPYSSSHSTAPRHPLRLLIALVALLGLGACAQETPVATVRFTAFSAQVDLSLVGVTQRQAKQAAALIQEDFAFMEQAWHAWHPGPMGRVNRLLVAGEPFIAPPSTMPLVRLSKAFEDQSGGLFNPAIGYLMDLWGFHADAVRDDARRRLCGTAPIYAAMRASGAGARVLHYERWSDGRDSVSFAAAAG